jgi:hypothetical protein
MNDDLDRRLQELLAERGKVEPNAVDRALGAIDGLPQRRRSSRSAQLTAAAVIALAVIGLGLAAVLPRPADVATPSPSPSTPSLGPTSSPAVVTPSPTPTVQPRPVWAMNLADHLDCDGPPSTMGMDVPAVLEPSDSAPTPEGVLPVIQMLYPLPASGFSPVLVDGHWALYRYLVDGRAKVHAVSTDQVPGLPTNTAWYVVGLRACDPSEFEQADFAQEGNTIWLDGDGDPVRTDVITSRTGPAHCGWERTIFLSLGDLQYFRDPHGDLEPYTVVPFRPDARLPDDAVDTGFHTDDWHLFTIPSGRAVFVRTADGTNER